MRPSNSLQRWLLTAVMSAALLTPATAQSDYTVKFVDGQLQVQSAPDAQGRYQLYSVPLEHVRVETKYREDNNSPQPGFTPSPPERDSQPSQDTSYAQEILKYTNQERTRRGLTPLQLHPSLTQAAQSHSQEMLERGYFSHTSPTKGRRSTSDRVRQAGASPRFVAENIFQCSGYPVEELAKLAVDNWMQSPGHRRNILESRATHIGIGLVNRNGESFVTQVFAGGL